MDISEWTFADDVVIMVRTTGDLKHNLIKWNAVLEQIGMKINKSKTKVMMMVNELEYLNIKVVNKNI